MRKPDFLSRIRIGRQEWMAGTGSVTQVGVVVLPEPGFLAGREQKNAGAQRRHSVR